MLYLSAEPSLVIRITKLGSAVLSNLSVQSRGRCIVPYASTCSRTKTAQKMKQTATFRMSCKKVMNHDRSKDKFQVYACRSFTRSTTLRALCVLNAPDLLKSRSAVEKFIIMVQRYKNKVPSVKE